MDIRYTRMSSSVYLSSYLKPYLRDIREWKYILTPDHKIKYDLPFIHLI